MNPMDEMTLDARIESIQSDERLVLEPRTESVQYLRGVSTRASFLLPALYNHFGAMGEDATEPYWRVVQAAGLKFSSLQTISLICRSVFDESRTGLSGRRFATVSESTLQSVADYWGKRTARSSDDARKALNLLRDVLDRCSRQPKLLLDAPSRLERRVGLLKLHANREAAHLSLEPYLFDSLDLVHVVAAIVVMGAIIHDFDSGAPGSRHFDNIDEAGLQAARSVFPSLAVGQLFRDFDIHERASLYWRHESADGLDTILNGLPACLNGVACYA